MKEWQFEVWICVTIFLNILLKDVILKIKIFWHTTTCCWVHLQGCPSHSTKTIRKSPTNRHTLNDVSLNQYHCDNLKSHRKVLYLLQLNKLLTSCKMGTGSFPGIKCGGRFVLLTTHPLLVPRSWKNTAIPLPTLWATPGLWREQFTFTLFNKLLQEVQEYHFVSHLSFSVQWLWRILPPAMWKHVVP